MSPGCICATISCADFPRWPGVCRMFTRLLVILRTCWPTAKAPTPPEPTFAPMIAGSGVAVGVTTGGTQAGSPPCRLAKSIRLSPVLRTKPPQLTMLSNKKLVKKPTQNRRRVAPGAAGRRPAGEAGWTDGVVYAVGRPRSACGAGAAGRGRCGGREDGRLLMRFP